MSEQGGSGGSGGGTIIIETKTLRTGGRNEEIHKFTSKERPVYFKWSIAKLRELRHLYWLLRGMNHNGGPFLGRQLEALDNLLHQVDVSLEFPPEIPDVKELTSERDEYREKHRQDVEHIEELEERYEKTVSDHRAIIVRLEDRVKELQDCHDTYCLWIEELDELVAKVSGVLDGAGIPKEAVLKGENTINWLHPHEGAPMRTLGLGERVGMLAAKVVNLQNAGIPNKKCPVCNTRLINGACPDCQIENADKLITLPPDMRS